MHYKSLLAALSLPVLISAYCNNGASSRNGNYCSWQGTSPFCGSTGHELGDWDNGQKLVAWTKWTDAQGQLRDGAISDECYYQYGESCYSGYKRLWCYAEYATSTTEEEAKVKAEPGELAFDEEVFGDQKSRAQTPFVFAHNNKQRKDMERL